MNSFKQLALAIAAAAIAGTAAAQPVQVDFFGESTFRGTFYGVEHDFYSSTPCVPSNTTVQCTADSAAPPAYNAPRRVVERLGGNHVRNNYAISSTQSSVILNGFPQTGQPGVAWLGGRSEAGVAVLNTGINDAYAQLSVAAARDNYRLIFDRLIRTGHKVVMIRPNFVDAAQAYSNQLNLIFDGNGGSVVPFGSYLAGLGADFTSNVTYISWNDINTTPGGLPYGIAYSAATANGGDGVHPAAAVYENMAAALAPRVAVALVDTQDERKIAQQYILFFNRAVESGGADYWLGVLKAQGEAQVAGTMFSVAPQFQGLTPAQTVTRWYNNLFSANPDTEGLNYWVGRINTVGVGSTAVELLNVVRAYDYNAASPAQATHKRMLVHRTNVGVAYGFRLKRSAVDTSGMMGTITTDPASVYAAMQFK